MDVQWQKTVLSVTYTDVYETQVRCAYFILFYILFYFIFLKLIHILTIYFAMDGVSVISPSLPRLHKWYPHLHLSFKKPTRISQLHIQVEYIMNHTEYILHSF